MSGPSTAITSRPDGPPWTVERRSEWVLTEDPPEGWRHCFNDFNDDYTELSSLWTDAPRNEPPHKHNTRWIPMERIEWQRLVTPWVRENGSSETSQRKEHPG